MSLNDAARDEKDTAISGPFNTVNLDLAASVPIVVLRGGNRDITFADGDANLERLEEESIVSMAICDPDFVADPLPVQTARAILPAPTLSA